MRKGWQRCCQSVDSVAAWPWRTPQTKETTEEKPKESGGLLDEEEGLGGLGRAWEGLHWLTLTYIWIHLGLQLVLCRVFLFQYVSIVEHVEPFAHIRTSKLIFDDVDPS